MQTVLLHDKVMIRFQKELSANRTLHQFWGKTSNSYLLVDAGTHATYLIDCGMPSDIPSLLNILSGLPPLKRVVCTHFHVDHISGWIKLKETCRNTEIWFHEKARPMVTGRRAIPFPGARALKEILIPCMQAYGYRPSLRDAFQGALFGTPFKKGFPQDRIRYFIETEEALPGFTTLHTPGHRPEETSFLEPRSGAFISGDFIIVLDGKILPNSFVSSSEDQHASLKKIKQLKEIDFICPGHGYVRSFSARDI
jgi:glyoxylase-like metal-dependent hydrolase (beta-lactamase superfamily II)